MIATLTLVAAALLVGADDGGQGRPYLDPLFSDHAVLQRDVPIPVRGWAEPGSRIKVAIAGQAVETTADASGLWLARLGPYPAGGPHTLTVSGPKTVEVKDILIGDVWLCSGQSNMEWPVNRAVRARQEIAAADHPRIRLITIPKKIATAPTAAVDAKWEVCSPESIPEFSAVGYFFGRDLQRELDVPIGLIDSTWGGTVAEAWTSAGALDSMDDFRHSVAEIRREDEAEKKAPTSFEQAMAAWWSRNDPGSAEQPTWADPAFDASAWKSMELPGIWEGKGLPDFDGLLWYRKEIDLPADWEGKAATLDLGPIDDRDTTFVNGKKVGGMNVWLSGRSYKVPEGVLKAGRNVIAVRVLDTAGQGGFSGNKDAMKLAAASADPRLEPIPLAGPWSYKEGPTLSNLSTPPEPEGAGPNRVTVLYNGMIAPLGAFPIKGATWYQGESNAGRARQYRTLLPTMIRDWRAQFAVGDFPFLIVQLANYQRRREQPVDSAWAELREAQVWATKALPNVAVALAIDIGEAGDIHPTNKQEVGRRLALDALAMSYGKDVEPSGPTYKGMTVEGRTVRLTFDHLGGGLVAKGESALEGFAVAGQDGKFAWAEAKVEGDTVVLSSPAVEKPTVVRYAWADNPACNLYNQSGLPAVPFRTDAPKE